MLGMIVLILLGVPSLREASADPLDPLDFVSGGVFPSGTTTIDADALTIGAAPWPNARVVTQLGGPDLAVFAFDADATATSVIDFEGTRPVVLLFRGPASIAGSWIVRAGRGTGRGAGTSSPFGGGGGGFGGVGGAGSTGAGGPSYGDLLTLLEAGSNGGGSNGQGAGLGGGAIEIGAIGELDVSGLSVEADGESGTIVASDGTGGGSGGGVFLHGFGVRMNTVTQVRVRGGDGGDSLPQPFGLDQGGGGGAGGRIAVLHNSSGAFIQGGALLVASPGTGGDTDPSVPSEQGSIGVVSIADAPTVGVPEPSATLLGIGAVAALAWCARRR